MTVGDRIRDRRKELGLTQGELGKRLGWGKSAVCRVEKEGNNITTDRITRIAQALSCSPAYLMGWTKNPGQLSIYDALNVSYPTDENGYPLIKKGPQGEDPDVKKFVVTEEEYQMIQKYKTMSPELKKVVDNIIENAFQEKQEEIRKTQELFGFGSFL